MAEIPVDIMQAAYDVASSIRFLDYEERASVVPYIAKAINDERERCAGIAENATFQAFNGGVFPVEYRDEIGADIRAGPIKAAIMQKENGE